jgi:hypothetical protein
MQHDPIEAHLFYRGDANLQMLANSALIEDVGGTG